MKRLLSLGLVALGSLALLVACSQSTDTFVSIGTGSQSGVYYPVGNAIRTIVEGQEGGTVRVTVQSTAGSVYNLNKLMDGDLDFGIAQADRQFQAFNGKDQAEWEGKPHTQLRSVFSLHPEIVTLVAADDSGIRTVADLAGKRVNIGSPGSGQRGNAEDVLRAAGLSIDDLQAETFKIGECASMLQDGRIDAYFYTVGHPNGSLLEATNGSRKVRFVPITGMEALLKERPYYVVAKLPVESYPKAVQDGEVVSIGMGTTFNTRADVAEDVVYQVVKAVFTDFENFQKQHPALGGLSKEGMLKGLNAPLHPGAEKYYKEAGLLK